MNGTGSHKDTRLLLQPAIAMPLANHCKNEPNPLMVRSDPSPRAGRGETPWAGSTADRLRILCLTSETMVLIVYNVTYMSLRTLSWLIAAGGQLVWLGRSSGLNVRLPRTLSYLVAGCTAIAAVRDVWLLIWGLTGVVVTLYLESLLDAAALASFLVRTCGSVLDSARRLGTSRARSMLHRKRTSSVLAAASEPVQMPCWRSMFRPGRVGVCPCA